MLIILPRVIPTSTSSTTTSRTSSCELLCSVLFVITSNSRNTIYSLSGNGKKVRKYASSEVPVPEYRPSLCEGKAAIENVWYLNRAVATRIPNIWVDFFYGRAGAHAPHPPTTLSNYTPIQHFLHDGGRNASLRCSPLQLYPIRSVNPPAYTRFLPDRERRFLHK